MATQSNVTRILLGIASDEIPAQEGLALIYPAVYQELRQLARALMRGQPTGHTLSATALVHEAYLRLVNQSEVRSRCRSQFFRIAAKAMRSVLVDHARRRAAQKRGGSWQRITLVDEALADSQTDYEILDLNTVLEELNEKDGRMAQIVEMRVFGGLTIPETAVVLGVSPRTVDSDWKVAKAWLADRMTQPGSA